MTAQTTDIFADAKSHYLEKVDAVIAGLNGQANHPAQVLRKHARESLANGRFPNRKSEDWKYTSVRKILMQSYSDPVFAEAIVDTAYHAGDTIDIVFVNGHLIRNNTVAVPDGVFMGTLEEALDSSQKEIAQEAVKSLMQNALPVFEAIGIGLTTCAYFLSVEASCVLSQPIRIVNICDPGEVAIQVHPMLLTVLGKHSSLELIEIHTGTEQSNGSYINTSHNVFAHEGSKLAIYRLQEAATDTRFIGHTTIYQKQDSTVGVYSVELGAELMRNNLKVVHEGTNIMSNLYGVFLTQQGQHSDTQSFIDHATPHCASNELYKGILTGNGRGVFNGKIIVRQDAQKTNAYQQNSTLILSPNAIMDSKPQLEIFADDVKCSHGATIGQLDEDAMFYLRSRGLSPDRAQELLQKAFVQDVLDHFPNQTVASMFGTRIDLKMLTATFN